MSRGLPDERPEAHGVVVRQDGVLSLTVRPAERRGSRAGALCRARRHPGRTAVAARDASSALVGPGGDCVSCDTFLGVNTAPASLLHAVVNGNRVLCLISSLSPKRIRGLFRK